MKLSHYVQFSLVAVAGLTAGGCELSHASYHGHGRHHSAAIAINRPVVVERPVYVAPPPPPPRPVVVYQPAPPPPSPVQHVVVVREAPPPVRVERRPRPPAPGYVWVSGYWSRPHHQWVWVPGHWDRPPHAHATWHAHRWEKRGAEFHLSVGGWR